MEFDFDGMWIVINRWQLTEDKTHYVVHTYKKAQVLKARSLSLRQEMTEMIAEHGKDRSNSPSDFFVVGLRDYEPSMMSFKYPIVDGVPQDNFVPLYLGE